MENRIKDAIKEANEVLKTASQEDQDKLHAALTVRIGDLGSYQILTSWYLNDGRIKKAEAKTLYQIFGGTNPSPEKWGKMTLAERFIGMAFGEGRLRGVSTELKPKQGKNKGGG